MGAVDTFSAGFGVVNRHPSLLLFPLALDGLIWGLPAITVGPVVRSALTTPAASGGGGADVLGLLSSYDLLALLGRFTPSLLAASGGSVPALTGKSAIELHQPGQALQLTAGLLLVGFALGSWYLLAVAQAVRGRKPAPLVAVGELWRVFRRILALVGFGVVAFLAVALLLAVVTLVSGGLVTFVESLLIIVGLWVVFYLYFTVDAIAAGGLPARAAMRASLLIFRFDFGAAAWIVFLATVIRLGLPILWRTVAATAFGLIGASIANAYVGTGLAAATMVFFLEQWEKAGRKSAATAAHVRRRGGT